MRAKLAEIIFEDDDLLVVNKPAGLLTIPDRFRHDEPNLKDLLAGHTEQIFVVHRLDRDTSGLIIFAKNEVAHRQLSMDFEERKPEKYYLAIVSGVPFEAEGIIEASLAESVTQRGRMVVFPKGKYAKSSYEVVEDLGNFSLLKVRIFTGRLHQVRVHLEHINHPLLVDKIYGSREEFFLSEVKGRKYRRGKSQEERPLCRRHTLHAAEIVFDHPSSKERVRFEADLPKDMKAVLNQLRKLKKKR